MKAEQTAFRDRAEQKSADPDDRPATLQELSVAFREVSAKALELQAHNAALVDALRPLIADVRMSKPDVCLAAYSLADYRRALAAAWPMGEPSASTRGGGKL